ncbi:hypothetical protein SAMN05444380_1218 [Thermophagus xiamenensis]|uniref:Uncharacterized protein n=1 Tax=Thermophagus xiamenensis TaxID=385682 RepID=A0A1I2E1S3_9BACT|nr:hypothetical protein SAMN05444380_1218 [Thermophagus xiamenensis]
MITFKKQYINEVSKIYTDETSMAAFATKEHVNFIKPCEFHSANELNKLYTNEKDITNNYCFISCSSGT